MDQEPHRAEAVTEVYGEVTGLLHRPCPGRVRGYSGQVQPVSAVLDEHQRVQPLSMTVSTRQSQAMIARA
jgi:hypothetical protein